MSASILFVLSSASKNLDGHPTGWYLPEAAHPYWALAPHYKITFAAPGGPNPPLDPTSVEGFKDDEESTKFLNDDAVKQKLATALPLKDVKVGDYDVIFYVGGHGPMMDLATDPINAKLVENAAKENKIIAAVCHGPAALVAARVDGRAIFDGKSLTGLSNAEEEAIGGTKSVPFSLEDRLVELGAKFSKADALFGSYVVVDGNLITGQNPASSHAVGAAILTALQARN
ncbi:class I glutamine amidotransferase-like protein [Clavulina sp. PMI_390]|nr:class I glutamine amidotransferase-like protein [Clavulina sp. PMI_390]